MYCRKFLTLSNQKSRYKSKCIRIKVGPSPAHQQTSFNVDDGPLLVDFYQLKNVRVGPPLTKLSGVAHVIPTQILSMHMLSIVKK